MSGPFPEQPFRGKIRLCCLESLNRIKFNRQDLLGGSDYRFLPWRERLAEPKTQPAEGAEKKADVYFRPSP